jgi:pantoate--beta-alanine ligase
MSKEMRVITTVKEMHSFSINKKREGKTIALVPTMGFLHEGHLSLVKKAKQVTDFVVVSIFVNPAQFTLGEDFTKYPRDEERDKKLLEELNVDVIFIPDAEEIYPKDFQTSVEVDEITKGLEGEFRPTHFKGVTTIVSILFNSVMPDVAIFGQKDAQQAVVIRQMVNDLKYNIEINVEPIIREPDGLAMSSRNVYLNNKEKSDALILYKSLIFAKEKISNGEREVKKIIIGMKEIINSVNTSSLDYIRVVKYSDFSEVDKLEKGNEYCILIACRIGKTRLIDNIIVKI